MLFPKDKDQEGKGISKLATGISGFDSIGNGGLPKGRTTLLAGTSGSAKTVFACQFLVAGVENNDEAGVFVTFEESPKEIRRNMLGFGWDIESLEARGKWAFVDASPEPGMDMMITENYDLGALTARIEHAVQKIGAKRAVLDSVGAIFSQFMDAAVVRRELFRISYALKHMKVTALITTERIEEYGDISRFGVEEFVSDNVIILRNVLEEESRRRTLEVLKFRGTTHQKGEFPFSVIPRQGVVVIPLSAMELKQSSSEIRVTSGNSTLDEMCGGGFFRDSVILVSGATGTGKTLMSTQFVGAGAASAERSLLFAFEESREQLIRNAKAWGRNFEEMEQQGLLKVVCEYPEAAGLEDHLIKMRDQIEEFEPDRVVVDSFSALERVSSLKGFREFVIGLTSFIKHKEITGLVTATTSSLLGGTSITEAHISTITDSIILLRYVEMLGEMRRGLTVLKMRGSMHTKDIREFSIDKDGMHIRLPFRNISGILSGNPMRVSPDENDRIEKLFQRETDA